MLFNGFPFAIFFVLVFGAVVALPRRLEPRVLLGASLLFYSFWAPVLLLLLLGLVGANYALLRLMAASARPGRYLAASVVLTLAALGFFKYGAFALDLLGPLAGPARPVRALLASLSLPLGISFYAFEMVSLAVDVRRGRVPCPSLGKYALFVTFFPHLVAGPILRGNELLPQLEAGGIRDVPRARRGLWLFMSGLVKKTLLSDYLLRSFVDGTFAGAGLVDGPTHLIAMYSFAFQIYFDFSGYTDMARGIACVLGYELPPNFAEPYLSRDPIEFWRRWHATLSRWLRDYVYVPLGGNRLGPTRTRANLLATMLLGGVWHGAGLNFALWGLLHGVWLVVHRSAGGRQDPQRPLAWTDVPRVVLTFHLVCLLWVPFRAEGTAQTVAFLRGLFSGGYLGAWPFFPLAIVGACGALHVLERRLRTRLPDIHARLAGAWWGPLVEGALAGGCVMVALLASGNGVQFIYFQF